MITPEEALRIKEMADEMEGWCLALHGNHDEHQCHKKPYHSPGHECYCGVWW